MRDSLKVLLLCLASICYAGQTAAADYEVEILVYASTERSAGDARWPVPREWPATERALSLGEAGTRNVDTRALQAIADNLRTSRQYSPVLHWRWRQPGWDPASAKAVHVQIPTGSTLPLTSPPALLDKNLLARMRTLISQRQPVPPDQPLLDGTVSLSVSQFPHLAVDLVFLDKDTGLPVQLRETRRMRSGELHYLDHPRFGVLAQVVAVSAGGGN